MPFENIQEDPDVCSNCFRRTHDRFENNYRVEVYQNDEGEWDVRAVEVDQLEVEIDGETEIIGGKDDSVYRRRRNTFRIPRADRIGTVTVCACGFRQFDGQWLRELRAELPEDEDLPDWKDRPLPKWKFFEHAERLCARLKETGVGFDEDEFFDTLDELKSNPDKQFADDRIFEQAAKYASTLDTVRENPESQESLSK